MTAPAPIDFRLIVSDDATPAILRALVQLLLADRERLAEKARDLVLLRAACDTLPRVDDERPDPSRPSAYPDLVRAVGDDRRALYAQHDRQRETIDRLRNRLSLGQLSVPPTAVPYPIVDLPTVRNCRPFRICPTDDGGSEIRDRFGFLLDPSGMRVAVALLNAAVLGPDQ